MVARLEERTEEIGGGGIVADENSAVLLSIVLTPSEIVPKVDDEAESGAEDSGAKDEDTGAADEDGGEGTTDEDEGTGVEEDGAGPAEEPAALPEGVATPEATTVELLGVGGWLEGA